MLKNYLKIAWRNIVKNKAYSLINIFGLAMGMSTCVLIMLYVVDEMRYDQHIPEGDRIVRIASEGNGEKYVAMSAPIAPAVTQELPEIETATRLLRFPGIQRVLLMDDIKQSKFFEENYFYVDSTFFKVLDHTFKYGDKKTALNSPNSVILSHTTAFKLYGDTNPVGNILKISLPFGDFNYTVKGVLADTNTKSHIPAQLYLSMKNDDIGTWVDRQQQNWGGNNIFHTYLKLRKGTDTEQFQNKLNSFYRQRMENEFKQYGFTKTLFLQPVRDIYLKSNYGFEIAANGNIRLLYVFSSIAFFLLIIACINFMNLSTAHSEKRAKEVGMRKTIGATKNALVRQFLGESILMAFLALFLAIVLIWMLLPAFNQFTHKELSLLQIPNLVFWMLGLTFITGLISGIYPAFYLSSFNPIVILRGKITHVNSALFIRKGLVVFQFSIAIVLILGSLLINQQINFLSARELGFNKNQKIVIPLQTSEANHNVELIKDWFRKLPQFKNATHASVYPGIENLQDMLFFAEGKEKDDNVDVHTVFVDDNYVETLDIEIVKGRSFSKEFPADTNSLVLNETAIRRLGYTLDNVVGKTVSYDFQDYKNTMTIIGVMKDYHHQSLHQAIEPLALTKHVIFSSPNSFLVVDIESAEIPLLVQNLLPIWEKLNPNSPFAYSFLDKDFQRNYETEERISQLIKYFTLLGIVISCLGLFGLASFTTQQRIKEIGVRKILGANIKQIVAKLSLDFLKPVFISIFIASPVAYHVMTKWLQGFVYKIEISWSVFVIATIIALSVSLLTISFQTIKAAMANPVKSLRTE